MMVEAGADEISEDEMLDAIMFAHTEIKKIVAFIEKIASECGKPKKEIEYYKVGEDVDKEVRKFADKMLDENGEPFTAHTTNPVPFIVYNYPCTLREGGRLCDIAPTMLKVMGLDQPKEMTGESIIL